MPSNQTLTIPSVGQLLLAAVLIAAIGALTTFQSQYAGVITAGLVMAAIIAGVVAFAGVYKNSPGVPIPWATILTFVVTAIATVALWAAHQSGTWTTMAVISGVVIGLTTLEQEVASWTPPAPAPSAPIA